jgi:ketosteroid isomerase-like protein
VPGSHRELVESAYAAFNAGDLDRFLTVLHPDAEWHWPPGLADSDVYRGADEIALAMARWADAWDDFRMEPEELLERADGVFVVTRYRGRGRTSGLPIDQLVAHLWEFAGDRAVRMRMFGDVEKSRRRFFES